MEDVSDPYFGFEHAPNGLATGEISAQPIMMNYEEVLNQAQEEQAHPVRFIDYKGEKHVGFLKFLSPGFGRFNKFDRDSENVVLGPRPYHFEVVRTYKDVEFIKLSDLCKEIGIAVPDLTTQKDES